MGAKNTVENRRLVGERFIRPGDDKTQTKKNSLFAKKNPSLTTESEMILLVCCMMCRRFLIKQIARASVAGW